MFSGFAGGAFEDGGPTLIGREEIAAGGTVGVCTWVARVGELDGCWEELSKLPGPLCSFAEGGFHDGGPTLIGVGSGA